MAKTVMGAVVSLDGFIADDNDDVGPLFDWYNNGDGTWAFEGADYECRTWTGDVGTALFAAACLDADARYPIIDVV